MILRTRSGAGLSGSALITHSTSCAIHHRLASSLPGFRLRRHIELAPVYPVGGIPSLASQCQPATQVTYRDCRAMPLHNCLAIHLVAATTCPACDNENLASNLPENNPIFKGIFSYLCHFAYLWTSSFYRIDFAS
jgi:hypothetical protein